MLLLRQPIPFAKGAVATIILDFVFNVLNFRCLPFLISASTQEAGVITQPYK